MRNFYKLLFILSVFFTSCNNDGNFTTLQIRLTDAPGMYDEVNIDIQKVVVMVDGEWYDVENANYGVYDLLKLRNGVETLLGAIQVPEGNLKEIRLVLGDRNSLLKQGEQFDLKIPSGESSGYKIKADYNLREGVTFSVTLDMDAEKSVVENSTNDFNLKPVVRAYSESTSGALKGKVSTNIAKVELVLNPDETLIALPDEFGNYLIPGVPEGSFTVNFYSISEEVVFSIEDVKIKIGDVTNLGELNISDEK
jgi:hypothetical protein